ncbi:unnamed protein product [Acanthoscelides obtectus]|uniref:Uncharacterized protein n=1 Tax=Acanthoscelides obtectus TaxID=200917 RepID=A0A9P0PE18_ACAOB|nr:unnamed protein product [Acanthoscelides obtectus]CAK1656088.1 hypothetical protein AOBTE_LOCUS19567 [Acanthoscelides obtectus]
MGLLLLKGILLMISDAGLCKTVFKTSSTAGKINFSPIVCGFPDFAMSIARRPQTVIISL